jgi:hypothetical protein
MYLRVSGQDSSALSLFHYSSQDSLVARLQILVPFNLQASAVLYTRFVPPVSQKSILVLVPCPGMLGSEDEPTPSH